MDKALEDIKKAWEGRPAAGQASSSPEGEALAEKDDDVRALSDRYVEANAEAYAGYEHLSQELLVKQLEEFRDKGDTAGEWRIQAWLFHRFPPQNIGGQLKQTVRVATSG